MQLILIFSDLTLFNNNYKFVVSACVISDGGIFLSDKTSSSLPIGLTFPAKVRYSKKWKENSQINTKCV